MAINQFSERQSYKDYVNPWDLNTFASILQYKQQKYDQGAASIQSRVDNFASLDVLADSDKEYLNGKINDTLKGINSLGGADLSDSSVISQLSGYVGSIGKDPRIIDSVLDTKKIRAVQSGRSQINKDFNSGKKGVFRSDANEYEESKAVSKYLKAKENDPEARYDGPSSPISYSDYYGKLTSAAKEIKATATKTFSPTANAYLYMIKGTEGVTEDRIWEMAQSVLTPEERGQMNRDAQYSYRGASDSQIIEEYTRSNSKRIAQINREIEGLDTIKGIAASSQKADLIKQKEAYLKDLDDRKKSMQSILTTSREAAINMVFNNKYTQGLVDRFAYKKEDLKPVWDQGSMFAQKQQQDKLQFNATMQLNSAKFQEEKLQNRIKNDLDGKKLEFDYWKEGLTTIDGKRVEGKGNPKKNKLYSIVTPSMPGDVESHVIENLKSDNERIASMKIKQKQDFINSYATVNDRDHKIFDVEVVNGQNVYKPKEAWKKANAELFQALDDISNGRPTRIKTLPKEFAGFVEGQQALDMLQTANQNNIDQIRNEAMARTKASFIAGKTLSNESWDLYQRGKDLESKGKLVKEGWDFQAGRAGIIYKREQPTHREVDVSRLSKKDAEAYDIYKKNKSKVEALYQANERGVQVEKSQQLNHIATSFTKAQTDDVGLRNSIVSQANGYFTLNDKLGIKTKPEDKNPVISPNSFTPLYMVRANPDGKGERAYVTGEAEFGSGADKKTERVMIPIDSQLESRIDNFAIDPAAYANRAVDAALNKRVSGRSYGTPLKDRVATVVDFEVVKAGENRYLLQVKNPVDEKGQPLYEPHWVTLPQEFSTASEAYQTGKQIAPTYQNSQIKQKKAIPLSVYLDKITQ